MRMPLANCLWQKGILMNENQLDDFTAIDKAEKDHTQKKSTVHFQKNLEKMTVQNHPAGKFLWSAAIGDPFITWFFHRKTLKKAPKSFFWAMTKIYLLLFIPEFALSCLNDYYEKSSTPLYLTIGWGLYAVFNVVLQGFIGAKIMKKSTPKYNAFVFKSNERCAVWFMLAFYIGTLIMLIDNELDIDLPMTIFDLPYLFESIFWKVI